MIDKVADHVYISGAGPLLTEDGQKFVHEYNVSFSTEFVYNYNFQIGRVLTVSAMAVPPDRRIDDIEYL